MRADSLWNRTSQLPPELADLRGQVRSFLDDERRADRFAPRCNAWLEGHDPAFSERLGARGWLGITWPRAYGGQGLSALHRYVVIEELLAAGAPVAAHWIADRQTGPALMRFGTEEQRLRLLPEIAAGRCYFAIGMSEPDSGSDLASVRTSATEVDGGWVLRGTKVWTSHAHRSHFSVMLCRTSSTGARHDGLSQLIVDLSSPGVTIRPIEVLGGHAHFAEVHLDDVFVPDAMVLGRIGDGWRQVNAELAHERSGPERFLSTLPLLASLVDPAQSDAADPPDDAVVGRLVADLVCLRTMSQSIARELDRGQAPQVEAALVKDLGTQFENAVIEGFLATRSVPLVRDSSDERGRLLVQAVQGAPGFTIRGGTTEILRGIVAKDLIS